RKDFTVVAPPNLLRGPATDAPYLASFLESIAGPIVLVAHSYGGLLAPHAATRHAHLKGLVSIHPFPPHDRDAPGETPARGTACVNNSALNLVPSGGGVDLYLRWEANPGPPSYPGFIDCFANGVDRDEAAVLFAGQRPAAPAQFTEPSGPPAWKTIPSWS